jgi:Zn-dependent membrane protease YugP
LQAASEVEALSDVNIAGEAAVSRITEANGIRGVNVTRYYGKDDDAYEPGENILSQGYAPLGTGDSLGCEAACDAN